MGFSFGQFGEIVNKAATKVYVQVVVGPQTSASFKYIPRSGFIHTFLTGFVPSLSHTPTSSMVLPGTKSLSQVCF